MHDDASNLQKGNAEIGSKFLNPFDRSHFVAIKLAKPNAIEKMSISQ